MLTALFADKRGEIFDAPGYQAMGRTGWEEAPLTPEDMIPLPEGASLAYLPGRTALGVGKNGKVRKVPAGGLAVAALLPAGYTRTHLPAFCKEEGASVLPLYGYTAAALYQDRIYVAAIKSDDNETWCPTNYNTSDIKERVHRLQKQFDGNRIVGQLARCSLEWQCCTAQNLFYHRWEAGIPVSPACNADCLGCISLQPAECCPSPQSRITFRPTSEEIAAVGVYHLDGAPKAIVSFGQGCEGEPSLAFENIAESIRFIRSRTARGVINMNTNGGFGQGVRSIVDAGLDSMRVSIISAIPETYQAYYRCQYRLDEVRESIRYAKGKGVRVSLNMLSFPGLNDREEEVGAWLDFLAETKVDMIQLRNLNFDPDLFLQSMPPAKGAAIGVRRFVTELIKHQPQIVIGSFSHFFTKR